MLVLTIRTDKPEAELGLFDGSERRAYETWQAHRQLSATILSKVKTLLAVHGLRLEDIGGIVCYQGPGSFTGLRIGMSVANALADSLGVPVVATQGDDGSWIETGLTRLQAGDHDVVAMPFYGADITITKPRTR